MLLFIAEKLATLKGKTDEYRFCLSFFSRKRKVLF